MKIQKVVTYYVSAPDDDWIEAAVKLPRDHALRRRMIVTSGDRNGETMLEIPANQIDLLRGAAAAAEIEVVEREANSGEAEPTKARASRGKRI